MDLVGGQLPSKVVVVVVVVVVVFVMLSIGCHVKFDAPCHFDASVKII